MLDCRPVRSVKTVSSVWLVTVLVMSALHAPASAGDFLEWKTGDLKLKGAGYFQGDVRAFPNWDVIEDSSTGNLREDRADVRRLRAGIEMELGALSGEFIIDANELLNSAVGPDDTGVAFSMRRDLKNAYAELAIGKDHFIRAGHFKLPVTREFLTSAAKTDFAERSLLADGLAPGRDWGGMLGGKLPVAHGLEYLVGAFAGDGWADNSRSSVTGAGRLVLELSGSLEVATSASFGKVEADPEDPVFEPQPKSLRGRSASGWSFFERVHVDGKRRRLGADLRCEAGPLTLKGEVMQARDERNGQGARFDDLPAVEALGWAASAVLRLSGPRSKNDTSTGVPIDLAVRYESLRFNDEEDSGFAGSGDRSRNIREQSATAMTGGLSVWPTGWVRLLANAIVERYNDALFSPEGRKGNYLTLIGRLQIEVP
jgi:phosphate-selective porin